MPTHEPNTKNRASCGVSHDIYTTVDVPGTDTHLLNCGKRQKTIEASYHSNSFLVWVFVLEYRPSAPTSRCQ